MKITDRKLYDNAALDAKTKSEQADKNNTLESHRLAASAHYFARLQAWALGDEKAVNSHDQLAAKHFSRIHELQAGKANEVDKEGEKTAYLSACEAANAATVKAHGSGSREDHDAAASAHSLASAAATKAELPAHADIHDKLAVHHKGETPDAKNVDGYSKALEACHSDPAIWEKAKAAAGKGDYSEDSEYAVANKIYENMGGETKGKNAKPTHALDAHSTKRMMNKKELQASVKDGGYSFTDLQQNLREECSGIDVLNQNSNGEMKGCCWIADIVAPAHEAGETWEAIVQGADGKLYSVEFKMGDDNSVEITGDPKEVERTTDYEYVFEPETPETVTAKKALADSAALSAGGPGSGRHPGYGAAHLHAAQKSKEAWESSYEANNRSYGKDFSLHREATDKNNEAAEAHNTAAKLSDGKLERAYHEARAAEHTSKADDHAYKAEKYDKPEYTGKNSKGKDSLAAGRAENKLQKNYTDAAVEAKSASDGIKSGHEVAASKHRIAAEHAHLAGLTAHKAIHAAHASSHDARVATGEAIDAASHRIAAASHKDAHAAASAAVEASKGDDMKDHNAAMQLKASHHSMMAKAHESHAAQMDLQGSNANPDTALAAGGPGSGPRPSSGGKAQSAKAYEKTAEASTKTETARNSDKKQDNIAAAEAHSSAALAHSHAAHLFEKEGSNESAKIHSDAAQSHREMASIYSSKAMMAKP